MSDQPPEQATEKVTFLASPEILAELEIDWSRPVKVRAHRLTRPGDVWELEIQLVTP